MMKSPALRFPHFLESWESHKLGDLASITMGQSPNSDSYNDVGQGLPLIQGNADLKNGWTQPSRFTTEAPKTCEAKDIILSVRAPVGELARASEPCCIGRGVCAIRPHASLPTNSDFIYYLLTAKKKEWAKLEQGSTFTAVSGNDISTLQLHAPSIQEQELIAFFFSLLDKKISLTENKLTQLQSAKESLLFKIFSTQCSTFKLRPSESKKLTTIVEVSGGHTPSMADKSLWEPGKNIWLTSKDVKSEYLSDSEMKISDKGLKNLQQYPANSMVLVARSGILKHSLPLALVRTPFTVNQDLKVLQVKEDNPEFIFFALKAKTRKILQNFVKSGTTVQSLMMPELMQMELEIPDKATQDRIANFFILFDKKIEAQQKKLTSLNRLKQSLMQQMFA